MIFYHQVNEMGEYIALGGGDQGWCEIVIDAARDGRDRTRHGPECSENLLCPLQTVGQQRLQPRSRVCHRGTVTGQQQTGGKGAQAYAGGKERAQIAIGRRNHGCRPAHHMIARKHQVIQRKAHMVGHVARRVMGNKAPAVALDHCTIGQADVRDKGHVRPLAPTSQPIARQTLHDRGAPGGGPTEGQHRRGVAPGQNPRQRRMITVRMGDQDMADHLARQGRLKRGKVARIVRPRIDHRHPPLPHHIGIGATECHRRRVGRQHPPHAWRNLVKYPRCGVEIGAIDHSWLPRRGANGYCGTMMTFAWLKRYAPRSLYGRAVLILLMPVILIQLVVTVVFIQRHYEDVTEQMSRNVAEELRFIRAQIDIAATPDAALSDVTPLAEALRLTLALPDPTPPAENSRLFYDLSGRVVIATLATELDGVQALDLSTDEKRVHLTLITVHGPLGITFPRSRVSASNPHQLLVLMAGVSLLLTVISFLFLRNQVRPIHALAEAAEAFGRGRALPYRPRGASEVRAAGQAFLDMRNRIERQIEQRTVMLSGVSHDLRTPMTRLKLGLSMLDDSPEIADLQGDLHDMQAMLDSFLDFVQLDSLDDPELVDPAEMLDTVSRGAGRAGQDVRVVGARPRGLVLLRPMAVRRALENLIGNAVRFGRVVEVSCSVTDRAVVFSVQDDGPGIDPAARDEALKPFTRLDTARNQNRGGNVGLGLSIAMDIARQHGGTLRLDTSAHLGGLRADLVLAR